MPWYFKLSPLSLQGPGAKARESSELLRNKNLSQSFATRLFLRRFLLCNQLQFPG